MSTMIRTAIDRLESLQARISAEKEDSDQDSQPGSTVQRTGIVTDSDNANLVTHSQSESMPQSDEADPDSTFQRIIYGSRRSDYSLSALADLYCDNTAFYNFRTKLNTAITRILNLPLNSRVTLPLTHEVTRSSLRLKFLNFQFNR